MICNYLQAISNESIPDDCSEQLTVYASIFCSGISNSSMITVYDGDTDGPILGT